MFAIAAMKAREYNLISAELIACITAPTSVEKLRNAMYRPIPMIITRTDF
jgi:hypothetical protein